MQGHAHVRHHKSHTRYATKALCRLPQLCHSATCLCRLHGRQQARARSLPARLQAQLAFVCMPCMH